MGTVTRSTWPLCALASVLWMVTIGAAGRQAPPARAATPRIDFERQIRPILESRCLECHSAEKRKGGLSLANYGDALDGGRNGAAIRPGKSAQSLIVKRILGRVTPQMPKDEDALSTAEVALLRQWIDEGAREHPSSPPAPQPWDAPLGLTRPAVPSIVWQAWTSPVDRYIAAYFAERGTSESSIVDDARFARRAYFDLWGLLPPPDALATFLKDTSDDKRVRLVRSLLADNQKYAEHWISFWNDLLRNEDGVSYYSETAARKSISTWLLASLVANLPYDRFVTKLVDPQSPGDPEGFVTGVNWRGETSAAVTPWMQASQNTAQVFLGVNLKCNACHDSFISHWKLKDAYALAGYFSPEPRLQLYRCDRALNQFVTPSFLYPQLSRTPPSSSLDDRRATLAAILTDARNGRLPRTLVNRVWQRLFGYGLVGDPDNMDLEPWNAALLDWLAADFVSHGYDVKHLLLTIMSSRAYQLPAVARRAEPRVRGYAFTGPEIRRLTAEQFADAIGSITGEWSVYPASGAPGGVYGRAWRAGPDSLSLALGRPIRDQVTTTRVSTATTLQGLELVNGALLTKRLERGAQRLLGERPHDAASLFNAPVAGRTVATETFDVDISLASRLWLIVQENGSSAPERIEAVWANSELVGPGGSTKLSALTPVEASGSRNGSRLLALTGSTAAIADGVRVSSPSRLVYDIAGKGFTHFRGIVGIENPDVGSTLQPQIRFFIFDQQPNMDRLVAPTEMSPAASTPPPANARDVVDRIFLYALARPPSADERRIAEGALADPARPDKLSPPAVADLLWAVLMKPEFQLIY
jgi:hypothetical protein